MELDLSFQLDVRCPDTLDQFVSWFRDEWIDFNIEWLRSGTTGSTTDNWIEVGRHSDYRPTSGDELYSYPYMVGIYTRAKWPPSQSDIDKQLEFARLLISRLKEKGCEIQINAFFEDLL